MGTHLKIYHRFRYLREGESILYEPTKGHFYWLVMYVPKVRSGEGIPALVFEDVTSKLLGLHHIHCTIRIPAFRELARVYGWHSLGQSQLIQGCSYFQYTSDRKFRKNELGVVYQKLKRRPKLRTYHSANEASKILMQIDDLVASDKRSSS